MSICVPDLGTCKVRTDNRYDEKDHWVPQIPKADSLATAKPGGSRPQHARPGRTARGAALLCAESGNDGEEAGCAGVCGILRSTRAGARRGAPIAALEAIPRAHGLEFVGQSAVRFACTIEHARFLCRLR